MHLNKNPFVICKSNYYYVDGECVFSSSNCVKVNNHGDCEKVVDGMYYVNGIYSQCPDKCKRC